MRDPLTEPMVIPSSLGPRPTWAVRVLYLLEQMEEAAIAFVARYTRSDGTLVWREEWPGMDGSDDGYESFGTFPLYALLTGSETVEALARLEWEAVTWQFTQYGQVYREFDAYYDWMHHGESYTYLYYLALVDPTVYRDRVRAERFAALYLGEDPEAPNWDPELRMIRSPINGSRGPRFTMTAEDWVTHRPVLANYLLPYEDIPGLETDDPFSKADWTDDRLFEAILQAMNQRMVPGDVPLNLTATSLVTHAYLYTGEEKYRRWVLDYVEAWMDRAKRNGGILPDNVGPNGIIGERMNGKWWGGYYGWRWPHGARNILEATLIAGQNALLLTGDRGYLDLHRSQWDRLCSLGREENGRWVIPYRHGDRGWFDYRPPDPYFPIHLYATSWEQQDWQRLEALGHRDDWVQRARFGKGGQFYPSAWFALVHDRREEAVERMLDATEEEVNRRLSLIQADADEDPETWDVHHWQDRNPVVCEPLVQLAMGTPGAIYHGGLLHASLRFFDEERGRAGLPEGVAARVREITADRVQLELINADLLRSKRMILQAGTFGEHRFQTIGDQSVNARRLRLILEPGAIGTISLGIVRFVGSPSCGYALTPQSS